MIFFEFPAHLKRRLGMAVVVPAIIAGAIATFPQLNLAQTASDGRALSVRSDIQEANSETGVITARGNVQVNYPAREIQATAAQAQYFSRERLLVLTGNVYVLQSGNSMQAETITYLVDEGRFVATPKNNRQVESVYIVADPEPSTLPSSTSSPR